MNELTIDRTDSKPVRIEVADALRGFALLSIVLLHNVEHYDFYYFPEGFPQWLKITDKAVWDSVFFLFSGKSYAIFALLFGFSFFIQFENQKKKGLDFRGRFLWRLFLLLIMGMMNSIFYSGDILAFYALIGVSLIPVCRLENRAVLITVIIFMLQPWVWIKLIYSLYNPENPASGTLSGFYFGQADQYLQGSSFWELAKGNIWNGRLADITWSWEQGRLFQTSAIFMLGMLLGRRGLFVSVESKRKFWRWALVISVVLFILLAFLRLSLPLWHMGQVLSDCINLIFSSCANFALASVITATFIVLYQFRRVQRSLRNLAPFGRMSLTNYITQSILGSFIYYGYGLGLYKYTGASFSILIGSVVIVIQVIFSHWWLKHYGQGPLEHLWHKMTWINLSMLKVFQKVF
jgi:uncharacterized protein